jgi:hypothetical protein
LGGIIIPAVYISTPNDILDLIEIIKKAIRAGVALSVDGGKVDDYVEVPYNETTQIHRFDVSFNSGDDRTLKIVLDLNPDE